MVAAPGAPRGPARHRDLGPVNRPSRGTLHVAQINVFSDPQQREPEALLHAWPALVDIAQAPSRAGVRVSVLQVAHRDQRIPSDGVDYHFVAGGLSSLNARLSRLDPDVLHLHGLSFPGAVRALTRAHPHRPLLLQDHADRLPRWWRRPAWRRAVAAASGVAFCSAGQAEPFVRSGLLAPAQRIFAIPESTSRFQPQDRRLARAATGLHGEPCVLWVGHLDANKDPLTVLDGIARAAAHCPELQLWCCYGRAPLLAQVHARIAADPRLAQRVHLLGPQPHPRIEALMGAADLLVSGSHREGSGFALIEALACGLAPVVTDIPSFRALTGDGAVGRLWPAGDAGALAAALQAQWQAEHPQQRAVIRAHFERRLSLPAIGQAFGAAYDELRRTRPAVGA